jgi:hypothetical protein
MTTSSLAQKFLVACPPLIEESWRKTSPELFFLPPQNVLNVRGALVLEAQNESFLPWKVWEKNFFEHPFCSLFEKVLGKRGAQFLESQQERLIIVEVGQGSAKVFVSPLLQHTRVEFSSCLQSEHATAPQSAIGVALAQRLKASVPQELVISIQNTPEANSVQGTAPTPLVVVLNECDPLFTQSYSAVKLVALPGVHAEVLFVEGGAAFAMHRHTLEVHEQACVSQIWFSKTSPPEKSTALFERKVFLHERAQFYDAHLMAPQGQQRVISNVVFCGPHAVSKQGSAFAAFRGACHFDYEPIQEHLAPQGKSVLNAKMILSHFARAVFRGLVRIESHAVKTEAVQKNKNILLSKTAKIETSPRLEIYPHDVMRCQHGSATGEMDAQQLYYLATRGLNLELASAMILRSFVAETLMHFQPQCSILNLAEILLEEVLCHDD